MVQGQRKRRKKRRRIPGFTLAPLVFSGYVFRRYIDGKVGKITQERRRKNRVAGVMIAGGRWRAREWVLFIESSRALLLFPAPDPESLRKKTPMGSPLQFFFFFRSA